MPEVGDESDVGVVQVLPILSRELVDEDFDSSLRFSLDSRLFDSSFSTCLKKKRISKAQNKFFEKKIVLITLRSLSTYQQQHFSLKKSKKRGCGHVEKRVLA